MKKTTILLIIYTLLLIGCSNQKREYFVSWQGWKDDKSNGWGWGTFTSDKIKNGNRIKEIADFIKEKDGYETVII